MKLKYLFAAIVSSLVLFAGCQKEDPTSLESIQLDKTYLSIPAAGGTATLKVSATEAWNLAKDIQVGTDSDKKPIYDVVPKWLTVDKTSGAEGETVLTFKADAIDGGRQQEFHIECGDLTQYFIIRQGELKSVAATCAEIIAGADGKTYTTTGVCTSIANTNYGNWYLQDETGEIYIYGTVDGTGKYNWSSFGIEVGDVVTVTGPKTTYNGTVELVDVTVDKVVKSLLKVDASEFGFAAAGGEFTVKAAYKGKGVFVSPGVDWIALESMDYVKGVATKIEPNPADTAVVKLKVLESTQEAARTAVVAFTSASGSSSSTVNVTVSQTGLQGTQTNPFTVAQAIEFCQTLTGATPNDFYVKGKISRIISGGEFGSYGNATFYISDDGEFKGTDDKNCDVTHDFEAYRILYFGNQKWVEGQGNIAVGDEVVICGQLTLYKGISETNQNKAWLYSVNGATSAENGLGNVKSPFNSAGAKACIDAGFAGNVYVAGIISEIVNNGAFGAQYGNATFWISDDGKTKEFEAYRVLYLGNRKWVEGDTQIAVGDKVVLCGALTKYGSTYETASGKAYIYSLNGKTE